MSSEKLEKLRSEALQLPDGERAELAYELLKSLDAPADADTAEAWEQEILRRLTEVESGTATLIDREELRRRVARRRGSLVDFFRTSPLVQEQIHLTLLDEASKGWEDVEQGRTLSVAQLGAKHRLAKKR